MGFMNKKIVFACCVAGIACAYAWITRELSLQLWLSCRFFETGYFRRLFHPEHFVVEAHQTADEALSERVAGAEKIISMGSRMLQEDMAEVHDVTLAVKGGELPLRVYVPHGSTGGRSHAYKGVVLWMHGGGWMLGSVDSYDSLSRDLAEANRMIVVSVGYRKAPEVQFPGPVKDCLAAVKWARKNIWAFGGDRTRLALVGESSGGNLAMATAILMSRSWIPFASRKSQLCAVVAASPPLSYEHARLGPDGGDGKWRSFERYQTGYGLEADQMKGYWDWYLRSDKDGQHPLASPLRAKKRALKGLPPVLLMQAEHEILWDEISEMGRNLEDAGQHVKEIQAKACIHGMFAKGSGACGSDSLRHTVEFLDEHCK